MVQRKDSRLDPVACIGNWLPLAAVSFFLALSLSRMLPLVSDAFYHLPDSALYLALGRALAQGEGYTFSGVPYVHAPPGYPFFLSFVYRINGLDLTLYHLVQVGLVLLGALIAWLYIRGLTGWIAATAVTAAFTANGYFMFQGGVMLLSEPLYLVLSFIALLALRRGQASDKTSHIGWFFLAGSLMAFAVLTRMAGLALIPAGIAGTWTSRLRGRAMLALVFPVLLFVGGWQVRNSLVAPPKAETYAGGFINSLAQESPEKPGPVVKLGRRITRSAESRIHAVAAIALNSGWRSRNILISGFFAGLTGLGWWVRYWRDQRKRGKPPSLTAVSRILHTDPVHLYVVSYLALCCIAAGARYSVRYLFPVMPLLLLYLWTAVDFILGKLASGHSAETRTRLSNTCIWAVMALYLILGNAQSAMVREAAFRPYPIFNDVERAVERLKEKHRNASLFLCTRNARLVHLAGDVPVNARVLKNHTSAQMMEYMNTHPVTHIVLLENDMVTKDQMHRLMLQYPERFRFAEGEGGCSIYAYDKDAPPETRKRDFALQRRDWRPESATRDWFFQDEAGTIEMRADGTDVWRLDGSTVPTSIYTPSTWWPNETSDGFLLSVRLRGRNVKSPVFAAVGVEHAESGRRLLLTTSSRLDGNFGPIWVHVPFGSRPGDKRVTLMPLRSYIWTTGQVWLEEVRVRPLGADVSP